MLRRTTSPSRTSLSSRDGVSGRPSCFRHHRAWAADYTYDAHTNEYTHQRDTGAIGRRVQAWFDKFTTTDVTADEWERLGPSYEI
mgnify:CR=1 FL=1